MNPSLTGPGVRATPSAKAEFRDYFFGELDRVVAPLLELLGDEAVLIPEVYGEKRPRLRGWSRLTPASLDPYYFKALEESVLAGGNLGALLGEASGNLCTVDLDNAAALEPFLGKNPRLRETLSSTGSGVGAQFWIRIRDYYVPRVLKISVTAHLAERYGGVPKNPATGTYDVGEWRGGQKSTIWGRHASGKDYRILTRERPVEVAMEEILLPVGWHLRLIRPSEFGPIAEETEADRINATARRREAKKWRGGGGSH
jgi:hypothetical protein